jgi:hypothetical protein
MSDLGLALLWLTVQVALLLVPALALQSGASRRSPAAGAWVAAFSLGLVLVVTAAPLVPRGRWSGEAWLMDESRQTPARVPGPDAVAASGRPLSAWAASRGGWTVAGIRLAWARLERGTAAPAARCRPWGTWLAAAALAGWAIGFFRLLVGLWAVRLCRRRGGMVDDPGLLALLDDLRRLMGCRQRVELREAFDVTTPATAGWWHPVVLLPDDWRSWDDSERRAVLAHELAHIIRGDYTTGLMARAAVVLHAYHPLVRWMAGRLQIQQELAADALGARFAGGRSRYLVALSRLALRQDGRSPCWPARAFLPRRGTLIRRIAMLNQETETVDRTWPGSRRVCVGLYLMVIAGGVAMLRGPALGAGADPPADAVREAVPAARTAEPGEEKPIELVYIPDNAVGAIAFRPAATFRRPGMEKLAEMAVVDVLGKVDEEFVKVMGIDPTKPGLSQLRTMDIEWIACGVRFGRNGKEGSQLHQIMFSGFTVRTTRPFDWLKMLHAWGLETTEVHEGEIVYHRFMAPAFGPKPGAVYCPDDRTVVLENEVEIRSLAHRGGRSVPAFAQNADWERASRGLLAYALNNKDGALAKDYDLGRPDDAVVLSLVKGVNHWVLGVAGDDAIILRGAAACQSPEASESLLRTIQSLRALGQKALEQLAHEPRVGRSDELLDMAKALLANLRVDRADHTINVRAEALGTLSDFAALVQEFDAVDAIGEGDDDAEDVKP